MPKNASTLDAASELAGPRLGSLRASSEGVIGHAGVSAGDASGGTAGRAEGVLSASATQLKLSKSCVSVKKRRPRQLCARGDVTNSRNVRFTTRLPSGRTPIAALLRTRVEGDPQR